MRMLVPVLLLLSSPALALDPSQIQAASYTDCEKENQSDPDYKACLLPRPPMPCSTRSFRRCKKRSRPRLRTWT